MAGNKLPDDLVDVGPSGYITIEQNAAPAQDSSVEVTGALPSDLIDVDPAYVEKQIDPLNKATIAGAAIGAGRPLIERAVGMGDTAGRKSLETYLKSQISHKYPGLNLAALEKEIQKIHGPKARAATMREVQRALDTVEGYLPGTKPVDLSAYEKVAKPTTTAGKIAEPFKKVGQFVDDINPFHGTGFGTRALNAAGRALGGGAAVYEGTQAFNRALEGDYTGAALKGAGALGSGLMLVPHPVAKGAGAVLQGGSILGEMLRDNPEFLNHEINIPGFSGGGLAHLKKGGEPEFGEARAYEPSYSEKIRDYAAKYMSPQQADVLFGGPRATMVDDFNPIGAALRTPGALADAATGFVKSAKEGDYIGGMGNYAMGALNASPLIKPAGQVAKTAAAKLGPKAAEMAENYLTKIGGISHIVPPGQKAAHEIASVPTKMSDFMQNHIDKYLVPTQADRMAGVGGPSYSANQLALPQYKGRAWGSGQQGTATGITNLAKDPLFGGVENQIFSPLLGDPQMHISNQLAFDRVKDAFYKNQKNLTPELRAKINDFMQSGGTSLGAKQKFEPFSGFEIADQDMINELGKSFNARGLIGKHAFGGKDIGSRKAQIVPFDQMMLEMQDPHTLGAKTFSVGPRAFNLSGEVENMPRPDLNKAYPIQLMGKDYGVNFQPVPSELALMDFGSQWRKDTGKTMPKKSGELPNPGYFEHTVGYKPQGSSERVYPRQQVTEDWIKELQRSGFAGGGKVNAEAIQHFQVGKRVLSSGLESLMNMIKAEGRTPVVPVPNRWFANPEKFPYTQGMVNKALESSQLPREAFHSGAFIDPRTGQILDKKIYDEMGVLIDPNTGRPMMSAGKESGIERLDPATGSYTKSNLVRSSLFKPTGGDPMLGEMPFIATIEKGGMGHKYALGTEYATPTELYNTMTGANPTLRPRSRGDVFGMGDVVGQVQIGGRGQPHDVYEKLFVAPKGSDVPGVKLNKAGGGKVVKSGLEALAKKLMPLAEREANKAKFLEGTKVVDYNGKPITMYHHTTDFQGNAFDPALAQKHDAGYHSKGVYFGSDDYLNRSAFGKNSTGNVAGQSGFEEGSQVMPVHLAIKNPKYIDVADQSLYGVPSEDLIKQGYDGVIVTKDDSFRNAMGRMVDRQKVYNAVAFEPTQIKSAIGNEGTFNPLDPKLSKKMGGLATLKKKK